MAGLYACAAVSLLMLVCWYPLGKIGERRLRDEEEALEMLLQQTRSEMRAESYYRNRTPR